MLTCDVCKTRSKDVTMHSWALGQWLPMCDECWRRAKDPKHVYETFSEELRRE